MAAIQLSQRPLLVLAGAVVLHVILISAQVTTSSGIPFIQVVTFGIFSEVQRGTMTSVDSIRGLWTGYVALREAQAENEALKEELQRLQVRLQEERAQAQRAENFRELLELRERAGVDTVAAEVIAGPATIEFRDMTIDKGANDGVQRDMAVISPAGVVGRVHLAGLRSARVQMLIDFNAAAGVMIERTRAQGVVVGQGSTLRMDFVPGTADVKQGDVVVTSGIDKIYPKGFVVGTVDSVERGSGTYLDITVRPAVDFSRLEEVLVVTSPPPSISAKDIEEEARAIAAKAALQAVVPSSPPQRAGAATAGTPPSRPAPAATSSNSAPTTTSRPTTSVPPTSIPVTTSVPVTTSAPAGVPSNVAPQAPAATTTTPQNGTPRGPAA